MLQNGISASSPRAKRAPWTGLPSERESRDRLASGCGAFAEALATRLRAQPKSRGADRLVAVVQDTDSFLVHRRQKESSALRAVTKANSIACTETRTSESFVNPRGLARTPLARTYSFIHRGGDASVAAPALCACPCIRRCNTASDLGGCVRAPLDRRGRRGQRNVLAMEFAF
jgi:hypothetical protein